MAERPPSPGPEHADEAVALQRLGQQARIDLDLLRLESALARAERSDALLLEVNEHLVLALLGAQAELGLAHRPGRSDDRRSVDRDSLTGLPNRFLLLERFALAIASARRRDARLAVLFLDLDHFKQVNDTLGHAVGDAVLRHVSRCLGAAVRNVDTVSRHGGDEFVLLLTDVAAPGDAARVAAKILACLAAPERIGDHVVRLGASIGISLYPDDSDDPAELIHLADTAMYRAKRDGSGHYRFHDTDEPAPRAAPAPYAATPFITRHETTLARQELRQAQLQDANEHLLLAALGAQELQVAAERARGDQAAFLAVVAHELRNPLTPIRTAAMLMNRVPATELPRLQAVIERQLDHVGRLVGDLLDLSRFNAGKLRLQRRVVDLVPLVGEAIDMIRPAMDLRQQALRSRLPATPLFVDGDPVRLVQVLSNLLDNASKYTPHKGTVTLDVRGDGAKVVVVVADDGIGIRAEVLADIFLPFVQDPHATKFHSAGLGIGLTVVRELVEGHGGTVAATSGGHGKGSRFEITLPQVPAPE